MTEVREFYNAEAEQGVLGSILIEPTMIEQVSLFLKPEDFASATDSCIFKAMMTLYEKGSPSDINMIALVDYLRRQEQLEYVGGKEYLAQLSSISIEDINAEGWGKIVERDSVLRRLNDIGPKIAMITQKAETAEDAVQQVEREVFSIGQSRQTKDFMSIGELIKGIYEDTSNIQEGSMDGAGIQTEYDDVNEIISGLKKSDVTIIAARPSMGKAQPLDAQILTTNGWKNMGSIVVGDSLASIDGQDSIVLGVYPQGKKQIYKVTFSDGRSTECCAEHLWKVNHRHWDNPRILSTKELIELLKKPSMRRRLSIDKFQGFFGSTTDALPIDPWLLGVLIGDGSFAGGNIRFSTADEEMVEAVNNSLGSEYTLKKIKSKDEKYDYRIVMSNGCHQKGVPGVKPNLIKNSIAELGLFGKHSHEKFIPEAYKSAGNETRLGVLQGLMDTDGWVEKNGSLGFSTSSERLAHDFVYLVRSLGGSCRLTKPRAKSFTHKGVKKEGRLAYVVTICHANPSSLMKLGRKINRTRHNMRQANLTFTSIEPTRIDNAQCIHVSHPSHLYVTNDFVMTHNTAMATNIATDIAKRGIPVGIFSVEMSAVQIAHRIISSEAGIDSKKLLTGNMDDDEWYRFAAACGTLSECPIYIDDTTNLPLTECRSKARRIHEQHGVSLFIIDYLQLMSNAVQGNNRFQEVSSISRGIKAIARDLNVPIIALAQLSRASEHRADHEPQLSDLRESGQIEQDADIVMFLHREGKIDKECITPNNVDVNIAKNRNGPTGRATLYFDDHTAKFYNMDSRIVA